MEYDGMIPLMYELCHPGSTAGSKAWMDARWEPPSAWKRQPGFPGETQPDTQPDTHEIQIGELRTSSWDVPGMLEYPKLQRLLEFSAYLSITLERGTDAASVSSISISVSAVKSTGNQSWVAVYLQKHAP